MRHGIIRTTRLGLNPDPDITSLSTAGTLVNDANYNLKMLRQSSDPLISVVDDDFPVIMPDTDYWWYNTFTGATNRTTVVLVVNAQRFFPFYIRENLRTDRLRLLNTTTATGSFAIAIYDAHPTTKLPRNRLLEFLSINTSSATVKEFTFSTRTFGKGLYWLAYWSGVSVSICAIPLSAVPPILGYDQNLSNNGLFTGFSVAQTYTAGQSLPNPAPALTAANRITNTTPPMILMRYAP